MLYLTARPSTTLQSTRRCLFISVYNKVEWGISNFVDTLDCTSAQIDCLLHEVYHLHLIHLVHSPQINGVASI